MSEKNYYLVRVKEEFEDAESGKIKKTVRQKLVNAVSVTDSEAKVNKLYTGVTFDWAIVGSTLSVIDEVIE
jgi:hypothetical protein